MHPSRGPGAVEGSLAGQEGERKQPSKAALLVDSPIHHIGKRTPITGLTLVGRIIE